MKSFKMTNNIPQPFNFYTNYTVLKTHYLKHSLQCCTSNTDTSQQEKQLWSAVSVFRIGQIVKNGPSLPIHI